MERLEQLLRQVLDDAFVLDRKWGRGRSGESCMYGQLRLLDHELRIRQRGFRALDDTDFCRCIRRALNQASVIDDDWTDLADAFTKSLADRLDQLDVELRLQQFQLNFPTPAF
jgi:hypothetical protein